MANVKNLLLVISILFCTSNLAQNFMPNTALENLENDIIYTDDFFSSTDNISEIIWADIISGLLS